MACDKLGGSDEVHITKYGIRDKVITDVLSNKDSMVQELVVALFSCPQTTEQLCQLFLSNE